MFPSLLAQSRAPSLPSLHSVERSADMFYANRLVTFAPPQAFADSEVFGEIQSTLESAIDLCSKYSQKNWLKKAWQSKSDTSIFEGIVKRLGNALADAQFGLQIDGAFCSSLACERFCVFANVGVLVGAAPTLPFLGFPFFSGPFFHFPFSAWK